MTTPEYYTRLLTDGHAATNRWNECDADKSKLAYLGDHIFNFTTYDDEVSALFANAALETCHALTQKKTFDYIDQSPQQYRLYLTMVNMPFFEDKLEWGTSVRGAWWRYTPSYKHEPIVLKTCGLFEGSKQVVDPEFTTDNWVTFINALLEFAK